MKYSIIIDKGADQGAHDYRPLFTEHFKGPHFRYQKRERPKMMKKLLRTVKHTNGEIISVKSVFDAHGRWVKIIYVQ